MKTTLFAVRDINAQLIVSTIFQKREGPAIRAFHEILADPQTMPGKYPRDFELRKCGEMNDDTGELTPITPPEVVDTGAAWLREMEKRMTEANT